MNITLTQPTYGDLIFLIDEIERLLTVIELQDIKAETRAVYMKEVIRTNSKVRLILESVG